LAGSGVHAAGSGALAAGFGTLFVGWRWCWLAKTEAVALARGVGANVLLLVLTSPRQGAAPTGGARVWW
jgi:hypothetical protein